MHNKRKHKHSIIKPRNQESKKKKYRTVASSVTTDFTRWLLLFPYIWNVSEKRRTKTEENVSL